MPSPEQTEIKGNTYDYNGGSVADEIAAMNKFFIGKTNFRVDGINVANIPVDKFNNIPTQGFPFALEAITFNQSLMDIRWYEAMEFNIALHVIFIWNGIESIYVQDN